MFSDISRRKGNQTLKFSTLIEYNMRNIFMFYTVCFYCISKSRAIETY